MAIKSRFGNTFGKFGSVFFNQIDLAESSTETISPEISDSYFNDMSTQLYGWEELIFIPWWGN